MKRNCPFFFHHGLFYSFVQSNQNSSLPCCCCCCCRWSPNIIIRSRLTCRSAGPAIPLQPSQLGKWSHFFEMNKIKKKQILHVEAQDLRCCLGFVHRQCLVCRRSLSLRVRVLRSISDRVPDDDDDSEVSIGFRINGISWWRQAVQRYECRSREGWPCVLRWREGTTKLGRNL